MLYSLALDMSDSDVMYSGGDAIRVSACGLQILNRSKISQPVISTSWLGSVLLGLLPRPVHCSIRIRRATNRMTFFALAVLDRMSRRRIWLAALQKRWTTSTLVRQGRSRRGLPCRALRPRKKAARHGLTASNSLRPT